MGSNGNGEGCKNIVEIYESEVNEFDRIMD